MRSGLEKARKNRLPGYDAELVEVLKKQLYPHATRSLEWELHAAPPSPEAFLEVFFRALEPFSQMLRDVLAMFEAAGARRSDENLRIAFDFDKASEELALTLREFREVEAFFRRVARPIVERLWNSDTLFMLDHDVREVLEALGVRAAPREPSHIHDLRIRSWIEENGRPAWLPFPAPGFPRSGDAELDEALNIAEGLIHYMYTELRKLGATYDEFARRLSELSWDEPGEKDEAEAPADDAGGKRPRRAFVSAAHDFWSNSFAESVCIGVEAVNNCADAERPRAAKRLARAILAGFDRPPRRERTRVSLEKDFRDIVNLPIWKKRHELYAVWVASRIADALYELSWEWHPDGDTLRFSFAGVELATLFSGDGGMHVFWTEKRTELKGGGILGRKHIQPDYRIMTVPTHRDDSTSLVVECKQYRNWSKKNFGAALDDYAKGCPNAPVVLVNYGPTDSAILDFVDASRRDRTFLVGDFKPGGDTALNQFRDLVQDAYTAQLSPRIMGVVDLRWGPMFGDLDLHLFIRLHTFPFEGQRFHIGFGSSDGDLRETPWAEWSEDIRGSPPGLERIRISRWLNADYDVLVHDYSGSPGFPHGDVNVRVVCAPRGDEHLFVPHGGTGRWWHVCRIQGAAGKVEEINRVHSDCPYPYS